MLRIDLRVGERIHIGNDIVIVLEEKNGRFARFGIDAPRHLEIKRSQSAANDNAYERGPSNFPPQLHQNIDRTT